MKNPSDYIKDEILELKGSRTKLRLILWELMKQARTIDIKQELQKRK